MQHAKQRDTALVGAEALGHLMPMYLWITPTGLIRAAGPTLMKLLGPGPVVGQRFVDKFQVDRPRALESMADVQDMAGKRIHLSMRDQAGTSLRGQAQPLDAGQGWLLNLSFGISVAQAVRDHGLTNADFAATDLTVELLYLTEVKEAVMGELAGLNRRLQAARATSESQARTDELTGLANRRALEDELERACRLAARGVMTFALMLIDLDHFKKVNDTLGHAAGDMVLIRVASILRETTRASDTVARIGGDEFVVILRGENSADQARDIGERIIRGLEEPMRFDGEACRISGSVGVVLSSAYGAPDPEVMLAAADEAAYAAKRGGKGRCVVADRPAPHQASAEA